MKPDASELVYDGKLFDVTLERWGDREREVVEHPGSVAIVAVDIEGVVTLVRQRREAVRRELLELPAGTTEEGEAPLETAKRELEEEAGLTGGTWREVVAFYTTPGFCRERMHLFFAHDLESDSGSPAEDEELELVRCRSVRSSPASARSKTRRRSSASSCISETNSPKPPRSHFDRAETGRVRPVRRPKGWGSSTRSPSRSTLSRNVARV
jgi:ADP-ribose pyrophosphatase